MLTDKTKNYMGIRKTRIRDDGREYNDPSVERNGNTVAQLDFYYQKTLGDFAPILKELDGVIPLLDNFEFLRCDNKAIEARVNAKFDDMITDMETYVKEAKAVIEFFKKELEKERDKLK